MKGNECNCIHSRQRPETQWSDYNVSDFYYVSHLAAPRFSWIRWITEQRVNNPSYKLFHRSHGKAAAPSRTCLTSNAGDKLITPLTRDTVWPSLCTSANTDYDQNYTYKRAHISQSLMTPSLLLLLNRRKSWCSNKTCVPASCRMYVRDQL